MTLSTIGRQRHLLCSHRPTGTVRWPAQAPADKHAVAASVYCCADPACVGDAAAYVWERTGHHGTYLPFPGGAS